MIDGEEKLIEQAIQGEATAFGLLYDRYQPQIYRFIYLKVSHREEAEDLTHQVFLHAWKSIEAYSFQGFPFSSWLYRIARNQVIDHYRTRKSHLDIEDVAEIKFVEFSTTYLDKNLDMERVREAITKLPHDHQDIVILRFVEDMSPQEIATITGKTPIAVRLLQHRAIKNLKKILHASKTNE